MRRCWLLACLLVGLVGAGRGLAAERAVLVAGGDEPVVAQSTTQSKLREPFAVDFDSDGRMLIADMAGNRVLMADSAGKLTLLAGSGAKAFAGDGGPAIAAQFNGPHHLAISPSGDLYVADTWNNRVRRIARRSGLIDTVVGTGEKGYSGDGAAATKAACGGIYCLAFDPHGESMCFADLDNRRVRAVDLKTGVISTVAGNGKRGVPEDGADARSSPLVDPRAVAVDSKDNLYILERSGNVLRMVDRQGKIRTVAGTGEKGFSGDGGPARAATMNGPKHLCVDQNDNVLIADTENHAIRRYSPASGRIERIAGTGKPGNAGVGGPAASLQLNRPHGVYVDRSGTIYISDSNNSRVVKLAE